MSTNNDDLYHLLNIIIERQDELSDSIDELQVDCLYELSDSIDELQEFYKGSLAAIFADAEASEIFKKLIQKGQKDG